MYISGPKQTSLLVACAFYKATLLFCVSAAAMCCVSAVAMCSELPAIPGQALPQHDHTMLSAAHHHSMWDG